MATKKTARKKTPRYKTKDGDYLMAVEDQGEYRLVWHIRDWADMGGYVGDTDYKNKPAPKEEVDLACWLAFHAAAPYSTHRDCYGFAFESRRKALLALAACNQALTTREKPWPPWAVEAKAAGWIPPKGWKP